MLTRVTPIKTSSLKSKKFKDWLRDQASKGAHYHFHAFSDGVMLICPPGTEIESETGTKFIVQENGSLKSTGKRMSRAKMKKVTRALAKRGIKAEFVE